ncbi:MAG: hypothetical protein IM477_12195 [Microcystis sp. M090S1]|nr:hypothetical protein [Microcystis sp. M090S1]
MTNYYFLEELLRNRFPPKKISPKTHKLNGFIVEDSGTEIAPPSAVSSRSTSLPKSPRS